MNAVLNLKASRQMFIKYFYKDRDLGGNMKC